MLDVLIVAAQLMLAYYGVVQERQERECLTINIYWEATVAKQTEEGRLMVGYVTVARASENLHKWGGNTLCGVVHKIKQFSWTLKPHGTPSNQRWWNESQDAANKVLAGWKPTDKLIGARYYNNPAATDRPHICKFKQEFVPLEPVQDHMFYAAPTTEELAAIRSGPKPAECLIVKIRHQKVHKASISKTRG